MEDGAERQQRGQRVCTRDQMLFTEVQTIHENPDPFKSVAGVLGRLLGVMSSDVLATVARG